MSRKFKVLLLSLLCVLLFISTASAHSGLVDKDGVHQVWECGRPTGIYHKHVKGIEESAIPAPMTGARAYYFTYYVFRPAPASVNSMSATSASQNFIEQMIRQPEPVGSVETYKEGLNMTPTQFMNMFNDFTKSNGISVSIPTITLEKENDVIQIFTHSFSEKFVLLGIMRKTDKMLLELGVFGDPGYEDRRMLPIIYDINIGVFNPELSDGQRRSIIRELSRGNLAEGSEVVSGSIRYRLRHDNVFGGSLIIKNVND